MHFSSSGGLSPSSRDGIDPITELLSQLSGVRRSGGGGTGQSSSTPSQLQQLQMQLQLERQQVRVCIIGLRKISFNIFCFVKIVIVVNEYNVVVSKHSVIVNEHNVIVNEYVM